MLVAVATGYGWEYTNGKGFYDIDFCLALFSKSSHGTGKALAGGGGGYMTCGWTGVCRPVFKKLPASIYRMLLSCPLL